MDRQRKQKGFDSLSDTDPLQQEDNPSLYKSSQLYLSPWLATSGLTTFIHQLNFEVKIQQSFGFLISDFRLQSH